MNSDEIIRCLSAEDQKAVRDMRTLFDTIDRRVEKFSRQTGLKCKEGCGACCTSPDVETTVAEVLPLAVHWWANDPGLNKWADTRSAPANKVCYFYRPNPAGCGQGRCSIYAHRPGLCRLFGFSARKDKRGQQELITCKVIKEGQPQVCQRTQEQLQKGDLDAPLLTAHAFDVSNIDPIHGRELLPINQAISLAIEQVGYRIKMTDTFMG